MTTQTERVSDERLRELLAGCEGVPSGEWFDRPDILPNIAAGSTWIATTRFPYTPHAQIECVTKHILNCHPDTIRSIVSELLALRAAVKPFVDFLEQGRRLKHTVDTAFCDIETGTSAALTKRQFERLETLTKEPTNV